MPTPYGSRGGMAFSADELRVLRRALDIAVRPESVPSRPGPAREAEVRACLRLARAVDEAGREGARLRAFLLTDLVRHREALPGAASGYVQRLRDALADGYRPGADDLAALRSLCGPTVGEGAEAGRRRALLARCEHLAEQAARARLAARAADAAPTDRPEAGRREAGHFEAGRSEAGRSEAGRPEADRPEPGRPEAGRSEPGCSEAGCSEAGRSEPGRPETDRPEAGRPEPARTRLMALPGGCTAGPDPKPGDKPAQPPAAPQPKPKPSSPRPERPIPTPGEVFPPRRKPAQPSAARGLTAARPA
ncbi:hypothetical protein LE181_09200 [Streptomyces sp. SCA3-4]|uniref:hypothetical protein n=1 Tax=Streptomyces sichuanensis TaxID=2871810 RepID=UPI001CE2C9EE|nr:hypothetical protein [Streptomyces sichuanensis]MCA6092336.1 hypothetical protein [Streptomyces sichuanensis]